MIKFGTGGWRAEIGNDFTILNIKTVAQAVANRIIENNQNDKPVVVGYDRRFLSDKSVVWISDVLAANGIQVLVMHRSVPTPLIMHTVMKQKLHYGLMVTASHNPSNYNGIKLIIDEGRDAPVEITDDIERRCAQITEENIKSIHFSQGLASKQIQYMENPFNDFLDDILSVLDVQTIKNRGPRILFDSMHGSSTYPFNVIFYTTRCTVDQINANKDAFFGGKMPAPTEETLSPLASQVVAGGYDVGMGIDGDGDRLGVIDSDGKYISANDIIVLLYYYLHEYKGWKGPVVRNLATTHLLDKVAESFGEKCYEVPVGFKWISAKIDEVDAVLGGESSGGLTVRGHIHGKDSIYASALFIEMICRTGQTPGKLIRDLKAKFGEHVMVEYNVPLSQQQKESLQATFKQGKASQEASTQEAGSTQTTANLPTFSRPCTRINFIDGCKHYFDDGSFVICRPSGTEPILRVFAEAPSKEQAQGYIDTWKAFLSN